MVTTRLPAIVPPHAERQALRAAGLCSRRGRESTRSAGAGRKAEAPRASSGIPARSALDLQAGGVGPQPFQVVEGPGLAPHDVDHHVAVVHDDPAAGLVPLHRDLGVAGLLERLVHVVGDGPGLAVGVSAHQDQVVGVGGEAADVEDQHVLGLLVEAGGGHQERGVAPRVGLVGVGAHRRRRGLAADRLRQLAARAVLAGELALQRRPLLALRAARPGGRALARAGPLRRGLLRGALLRRGLLLRRHSSLVRSGQARTWPSPSTTNFRVVSSLSPIGPKAWSLLVEMPISAPSPSSPPSLNRVEALITTALAVTSRSKRRALARSRVRIDSVWSEPWRATW